MRCALFLSLAACDVAAPLDPPIDRAVYTIQPGDTLGAIGARFGVSARALAGGGDPDRIRAGARLIVPDDLGPDLVALPDVPAPAPSRACELRREPIAPPAWVMSDLPVAPPVELDRVDLDGDGHDETIVAALVSEHGTLDRAGWRLWIGDAVGAPAVELDVDEWGDGSLVARDDYGCDLLATSWEDVDDAVRGPGLYLVARRMAYRDGALEPVGGFLPARRYTDGFHDERLAHLDDDLGAPRPLGAWLEEGELRADDPAREGELRGFDEGVVIAARRAVGEESDTLALEVRRRDGVVITLDPFALMNAWELPEGTFLPRAYGWRGTGIVQPPGWIPRDPASLVGREVTLEWHDDLDDDDESPIAWIAP